MKIIIFDQNLRVADNPALLFAIEKATKDQEQILPIFVLDEKNKRKLGGASKWFLHFALEELQKNLQKLGLNLLFFKGNSLEVLSKINEQNSISEIYFNKLYEPFNIRLQNQIEKWAKSKNIQIFSFKSYLLFEPDQIKNGGGSYFKVFTPFWKHCLKNWDLISKPIEWSKRDIYSSADKNLYDFDNIKLLDLNLLPKNPNWAENFKEIWQFEYQQILNNFNNFLINNLKNYKENRNFPALKSTSKISPYLHFGLISIAEIVELVKQHYQKNPEDKAGVVHFLSEIGWREFSHHLLFYFPELDHKNFKSQFDNFAWQNNNDLLQKWQQGQTGYPIIDAAMQELWQTGFMENRTRMIVASFLIKDLLIDWKLGEAWFWDCLVDANLANNSASWQWVAGSGADAAPYFRIFNPTLQSEKFDPDAKYIKKWLPQLKNIPAKLIHQIWQIDEQELLRYGVKLGKNYPRRILVHENAKARALEIYQQLKVK